MDFCAKGILKRQKEKMTSQAEQGQDRGSVHQKDRRTVKDQSGRLKTAKLRYCLWIAAAGIFFLNLLFQPLAHWPVPWDKGKRPGHGQKTEAEWQNICPLLYKPSLNHRDYGILFYQTGLGKEAVDCLRGNMQEGENRKILEFQEAFLKKRKTECCSEDLFIKQDRLVLEGGDQVPLVPLEDGDIFLSFSSHTLGWRHGHAGLVVDGDAGLCLEATMPGCASEIRKAEHWTDCADFVVLRLKGTSRKEREKIAAFARENLEGIPYSLFSGIFDKREQELYTNMKAQCAYLIWYVFMQFGYNLDSDGGRLVTVEDLLKSSHLEVLQVFGLNPGLLAGNAES